MTISKSECKKYSQTTLQGVMNNATEPDNTFQQSYLVGQGQKVNSFFRVNR